MSMVKSLQYKFILFFRLMKQLNPFLLLLVLQLLQLLHSLLQELLYQFVFMKKTKMLMHYNKLKLMNLTILMLMVHFHVQLIIFLYFSYSIIIHYLSYKLLKNQLLHTLTIFHYIYLLLMVIISYPTNLVQNYFQNDSQLFLYFMILFNLLQMQNIFLML